MSMSKPGLKIAGGCLVKAVELIFWENTNKAKYIVSKNCLRIAVRHFVQAVYNFGENQNKIEEFQKMVLELL